LVSSEDANVLSALNAEILQVKTIADVNEINGCEDTAPGTSSNKSSFVILSLANYLGYKFDLRLEYVRHPVSR
jgi:hypothetical protein